MRTAAILLALLAAVPLAAPSSPDDIGPAPPVSPAAAVSQSAEPTLDLPDTVEGPVGGFITVAAETNGSIVRWHAIDPGLNLFPVELLKDTRAAVVTSSRAGRYRLLGYTAIGDVPSMPETVVVIVGNPPDPGPQPGPEPGPDPVPPPDLTGIAKAIYEAARGVDKSILSQAAEAYGSQVSAINAGAYNSVSLDAAKQQISDAIASANPPRERARILFDAIDGQLQAQEESGRLAALPAISAVLSEIVTGLEAAR